jgi:predicted MFS family arabinose efflux permease
VVGGAVAVGPLVGGAITSGIGWRWIFFVNVPIGVVAIFITLTRVAESKDVSTRTIDWIGFFSFSLSLFALVFALVRGNDEGWSSTTVVTLLAVSAILMIVFVVNERRRKDPMLDLELFSRPAFCGVSLVAFCLSASIFSMFLYLTLYIQDDLGFGPFPAGVRFLPLTVLSFVVAPIAGRLTTRLQSRYLLGTGMVLVTIGLILIGGTHPTSTFMHLLPGFIVVGAGVGMVNPVLASGAISVVDPRKSGMASGANNTFRQVGIATGIAVLGAVFQSQIVAHTSSVLRNSAAGQLVLHRGGAQLTAAMSSGEVRQAATQIPVAAARSALLHAYQIGFSVTLNHLLDIAAVVAAVGAIGGFVLVRQRDFVVLGGGGHGPAAGGGGGAAEAGVPAAPVVAHG